MHLALDQTRFGWNSGDYSFLGFFKRTITSGKISLRTKLGLRSNSANTRLSSDLLLIFLNKIQLKIKFKFNFFLI
jgi:hypothetical protein